MEAVVRRLITFALPLSLVVMTAACGHVGGGNAGTQSQPGIGGTVSNPATEMYQPVALLWEGQNRDGMLWSSYVYQIIGNDVAASLLPGTDDIAQFCPNYAGMSAPQRVNFWAYLVSALAKYESGFNPTARVLENAMGLDLITGKPRYSEGLLRLSYQDVRSYAFCAFDWVDDQRLPAADPARSIVDPLKNLDCGIKIMATQIEANHKISNATGVYWTLLKSNGVGNRVKELQTLTRKLPFCALN